MTPKPKAAAAPAQAETPPEAPDTTPEVAQAAAAPAQAETIVTVRCRRKSGSANIPGMGQFGPGETAQVPVSLALKIVSDDTFEMVPG